MPNTELQLSFSCSDLPEGYEGTFDQFKEFLCANLKATLTGEFVTAQTTGARPSVYSGLFFVNGSALEIWNTTDGKYVSPNYVPVGVLLPWANPATTPPENYLICDGRLLVREDYPELFSAIGTAWNDTGDADVTKFRLPDPRSRTVFYAGQGDLAKQGLVGKLISRIFGSYFGREDLVPSTPTYANAPNTVGYGGAVQKGRTKYTNVNPPGLVMQAIIRYR